VLTDPPYGINYLSNHYKYKNPHKKIIGDNKYPVELVSEFINKALSATYLFCRWNNIKEIPEPKSLIVWVKNNWSAGDLKHEYGRQWEAIAFYPKHEHTFYNGRPSDVIYCDRVPPEQLLHPTQKPVKLMSRLISHCAGNILDPFMGSGTTLVAAKQLGRKAIGIELEEKYCDIAVNRLRQGVLKL